MNSLCGLPDPEDNTTVFHVIPGRIEYRQKGYDQVFSTLDDFTSSSFEEIMECDWNVSLLVTPRINGLDVRYRAKGDNEIFEFSPYDLTARLEQLTYTNPCPQVGCAKEPVSAQKIYSDSHRVIKVYGKNIELFSGNQSSLCINLLRFSRRFHFSAIFRQECCLHCCLRFAAQRHPSSEPLIILWSKNLVDMKTVHCPRSGTCVCLLLISLTQDK